MSQDLYRRLEYLCDQIEACFEKKDNLGVDNTDRVESLLSELDVKLVLLLDQMKNDSHLSQSQAGSLLPRLNNIVRESEVLRESYREELLNLGKGRKGVAAYKKVL